MPTEGAALTGVAVSATLHCLTGCAIGEVAGVAIGTAAGFSNAGTIALAIALAFLFGYTLTSLPLLKAGLALGAVIPIALASDTLSIATMEVVDNLVILIVPGAMDAGLDDLLFWGSLAFALAPLPCYWDGEHEREDQGERQRAPEQQVVQAGVHRPGDDEDDQVVHDLHRRDRERVRGEGDRDHRPKRQSRRAAAAGW